MPWSSRASPDSRHTRCSPAKVPRYTILWRRLLKVVTAATGTAILSEETQEFLRKYLTRFSMPEMARYRTFCPLRGFRKAAAGFWLVLPPFSAH